MPPPPALGMADDAFIATMAKPMQTRSILMDIMLLFEQQSKTREKREKIACTNPECE
jgi:hypothetical protein